MYYNNMRIKNYIRLFLPPVYYRAKSLLFPSKIEASPLKQIKHNSNRAVIIGNGPSLNESINNYKEEIINSDIICVNFFASTELYEELKPKVYVFADPEWFFTSERIKDSINNLFQNITDKTTWPMTIIVPLTAKNAPMVNVLKQNDNISIHFYRNSYQDIGKITKFEAWDKNLIGPPAQTVLNVCLYLSLYWGYEETYLIGADTSFLEDIRIDQENNDILTYDKHFYKNENIMIDKNVFNRSHMRVYPGWKLHDLIHAFANMFGDYAELKKYADYKGLNVYNASEYSWINCFERKKLR